MVNYLTLLAMPLLATRAYNRVRELATLPVRLVEL